MRKLRIVHAAVGLLSIVAFVLTGQYMHHVHNHLRGMPDAPRMLYRSAHIYLLLSGLLNMTLGAYLEPFQGRIEKRLQAAGSVVVLAAPILFLTSFLTESGSHTLHRPIARAAIYLSFGGIVLHFLAANAFLKRRGDT